MNGVNIPPSESAPESNADDCENNDKKKPVSIWPRLGYMLLIVLIYGVTRAVIAVTVVVQVVAQLSSGSPNLRLTELGESLATYSYQIIRFLTFVTEKKPYPFDETWPQGSPTQNG